MPKCKPAVGRVELFARTLLLALYQTARGLSLLSCNVVVQEEQVHLKAPKRRFNRLLIILWRAILVTVYWTVIPGLFIQSTQVRSYADVFMMLQSSTVMLFAVVSFIVQVRAESKFLAIVNRYIVLYGRICKLTQAEELFSLRFLIFWALKVTITSCGCLYELPQLLPLEYILKLDILRVIAGLIGIYMWLGTLFLLDSCFFGFLITSQFYEHMGAHLATMLHDMRSIDIDYRTEYANTKSESAEIFEVIESPKRLSVFKRMCLLCDKADQLEACAVIYTELYNLTQSFLCIFQWQILFYIYYNFMVLLIMLYEYILRYLEVEQSEIVAILMIIVKLANIVLLVLCIDCMIQRSQMPQTMPLDIVCSDIDERWDNSVESFLSQLQTQQLDINVMGLLQLNNRFIPTLLSAIIAYLFILIQFGFSGGFDESKEIIKLNISTGEQAFKS